jgi:hypothetical protein
MSNIKLEDIAALLKQELDPIKTDIAAIRSTVDRHTSMLDGLAADVKTIRDEKTISARRFDRLEHWAQKVGEKIGIKLEL